MIDEPFFITGCPKSGTTLALQLLNNHPKVKLDIELQAGIGLMRYYYQQPRQPIVDRLRHDRISWPDTRNEELFDKGKFRQIIRNTFKELYTGHRQMKHWGSNSRAIVFYHQQVLDLFPRAKFFVIIRDPRDVFCSTRASHWADQEWSGNIDGFIQMYNNYHATYMSVPEQNRYLMRYEDLIQEPLRIYHQANLVVPDEPFAGLGKVYRNRSRPWREGESTEDKVYNREGRWKADLEPHNAGAIAAGCAAAMTQWGYS